MGIHEWAYDNDVSMDLRFKVPHAPKEKTLRDVNMEVELGFTRELGFKEAQRCLNCDVETVFAESLCIECDACVDICPVDCITFTPNDPEPVLRHELTAPALNLTRTSMSARTEDPPRDGEGRGRLPALRAVRRALPDRGVGHEEILSETAKAGGCHK